MKKQKLLRTTNRSSNTLEECQVYITLVEFLLMTQTLLTKPPAHTVLIRIITIPNIGEETADPLKCRVRGNKWTTWQKRTDICTMMARGDYCQYTTIKRGQVVGQEVLQNCRFYFICQGEHIYLCVHAYLK